jgi:hypothetical protein
MRSDVNLLKLKGLMVSLPQKTEAGATRQLGGSPGLLP